MFSAKCASNIKDQATHVALVVTEEVKKQAEQRINSRFIMYVLGIHKLALKKTQRGRRYAHSAESQKLKKAMDYLDSAKKHNDGTIVARYHENE